jgi:hypothetical protein
MAAALPGACPLSLSVSLDLPLPAKKVHCFGGFDQIYNYFFPNYN